MIGMSAKKKAALKKKHQLERMREERERKKLLAPLFANVKKTNITIPKIENYRAPGTEHIKSLCLNGDFSESTAKKENQKYTGNLIKGIGTMHKSNAIPILNQEEAVLVSTMRRN